MTHKPKATMRLNISQGPMYKVGQLVVVTRLNLWRQLVAKEGHHCAEHQEAFYEDDESMYQHIPYTQAQGGFLLMQNLKKKSQLPQMRTKYKWLSLEMNWNTSIQMLFVMVIGLPQSPPKCMGL